jgi:hypothetical protein
MSTTRNQTPNLHATALREGEIVEESELGSLRWLTTDNFPVGTVMVSTPYTLRFAALLTLANSFLDAHT